MIAATACAADGTRILVVGLAADDVLAAMQGRVAVSRDKQTDEVNIVCLLNRGEGQEELQEKVKGVLDKLSEGIARPTPAEVDIVQRGKQA